MAAAAGEPPRPFSNAFGPTRLQSSLAIAMHLTRCHDQKTKTLDEFYGELSVSEEPVTREIGQTMLSLVARLRTLPEERCVWGLTSHYRLGLLASYSYETPWFVTVVGLDARNYFVEYLMPERVAPWPQIGVGTAYFQYCAMKC